MENASKALLIAGAVLLVILIISLSMIIYNKVIGPVDEGQAQLTSAEVAMFNSQFNKYVGKDVSAINVQNLLSAIFANNAKYEEGENKYIQMQCGDTIINDMAAISIPTSLVYNVNAEIDPDTGLINKMIIDDDNNILGRRAAQAMLSQANQNPLLQ